MVFGVNVLDLDFGVQIDSNIQPIKRNSVSPGNMSYCGTTPFNDHLDHCFVILKHIQQSFLMRRLDVWGNNQYYSARSFSLEIFDSCQWWRVAPVSVVWVVFPTQKQSDPINRERESRPISIQRPSRWFRILSNCVKQQFVSCTSNLLEQTYDFPKRTMFLQKWILDLQDLLRSQSLETVQVCIVLQYYPHDNIVCIHKYDEFMKSIDSGACHTIWSFRNRQCKFVHWP